MDELLQKALARRDELRRELETLEIFIRSYSEVKDRQAPASSSTPDLFRMVPRASMRKQRALANEGSMNAAEQIILAAGRPLSRSELLRELEVQGHEIVGSDKSKVLGTNLWRSKRFYNLKGAGYWPISAPIPEPFKHLQPRESILLDGSPVDRVGYDL
jgi:acyl-CoA hydrolase